ncbi:MAG: hypothetical protein LH629_06350, partial [Ignavibacteria bacterium]|nr:hypothetical protein [Ignavibacteria bacterium]
MEDLNKMVSERTGISANNKFKTFKYNIMNLNFKNYFGFISAIIVIVILSVSCSKLSELTSDTNTDKLYFCEKYDLDL